MNLYSHVPDLIKQLEQLRAAAAPTGGDSGGIQDAILGAVNAGRGLLKRRIFNEGLDAEGRPLGDYSAGHRRTREKKGRQASRKDLQLSGSLASSIETVKGEGFKVRVVISNPENAKIARYQEAQIGKLRGTGPAKIFVFSQAEHDAVRTQSNRLIAEAIKKKLS